MNYQLSVKLTADLLSHKKEMSLHKQVKKNDEQVKLEKKGGDVVWSCQSMSSEKKTV